MVRNILIWHKFTNYTGINFEYQDKCNMALDYHQKVLGIMIDTYGRNHFMTQEILARIESIKKELENSSPI